MDLPRKSVLPKTRPSNLPNMRLSLDHKQFSDKSFQQQCQRDILSFFQENFPEMQITIKHLQTPNTKDYILIFTTLMRFIDPLFDLLGKMEDEIPTILKSLGYPYTISKNSFLAIGAPNSWPALLASLDWLVDSLKEGFELNRKDAKEQDDILKIAQRAYELYIGTVDYEEEIYQMVELLEEKLNENTQICEEMVMNMKCLQEEKERLARQKNQFENSEAVMSKIRSHIFHVKSIMSNDMATLKQHEELRASSLHKLETLKQQLEDLRFSNQELSHRIQKQEYSVEEISKVSQEIVSIDQSFANLDNTVKMLKETNSNNEMLLASMTSEILEKFEKIFDISTEIPSLYEKLKIFLQPKVPREQVLNELFIENEFFPIYKEVGSISLKHIINENAKIQREISELVAENQAKSIEMKNQEDSIDEKAIIIQQLKKTKVSEEQTFGNYIENLTKELRNVDEFLSLSKGEVENAKIMNQDVESKIDGVRSDIGEMNLQLVNMERELENEVKDAYELVYKMVARVESAKRNVREFVSDQSRQIDELYNNYVKEAQNDIN